MRRLRGLARRLPATLGLLVVLLAAGIVGEGLWRPFVDHPWFEAVAYGLPALEAGRWWTPITGALFVTHPLVYLGTIPSLVGVMEFLIGSSARAFAAEGAEICSLSGAPLAHRPDGQEGAVAQLLAGLSAALEPVYGFASLHRFKQKFNPREEPIHLLYRDEGDLPRIAAV